MERNAECASSGVRGGDGELVSLVELPPEGVLEWSIDEPLVDNESASDFVGAGIGGGGAVANTFAASSSALDSRGADDELGALNILLDHDWSNVNDRHASSFPRSNDFDRLFSARLEGVSIREPLADRERDGVLGVENWPLIDRFRGVVGDPPPLSKPSNEKSKLRSSSGSCRRESAAVCFIGE